MIMLQPPESVRNNQNIKDRRKHEIKRAKLYTRNEIYGCVCLCVVYAKIFKSHHHRPISKCDATDRTKHPYPEGHRRCRTFVNAQT